MVPLPKYHAPGIGGGGLGQNDARQFLVLQFVAISIGRRDGKKLALKNV